MITCIIPYKTPSSNQIYKNLFIRGRVIRAKKGKIKSAKGDTLYDLKFMERDIPSRIRGSIHTTVPLKVEIEVWDKWYTQNGSIFKSDVMNREKFILDIIFNAIGIDDSNVFELIITKKHTCIESKWQTAIRITELGMGQNQQTAFDNSIFI